MADELMTTRRDRVVAWLRRLADQIESGELPADAALVVISEGDIHRPASIGFRGRDAEYVHARGAFHTWSDTTPEERAEWRAQQERDRQAKQDAYERAHPWQCVCGGRFKTYRGWKSHRGAMRRRTWERMTDHAAVTEMDVPEPEPPVQLFPDVS